MTTNVHASYIAAHPLKGDNPKMSRVILLVKVLIWRGIVFIKRILDLYFSTSRPLPVSFTKRIPASVGKTPGSFDLYLYTPKSYNQASTKLQSERYPVLVNFHGGGFTLGHASEDARWATSVLQETSAVIVSVNYRLAPRYPFPTPIEDCVSAVLWIWQHADELKIDPSRTAFSGFSAGGNMTYTVAIRLHEELTRLRDAEKNVDLWGGRVMGLASFYPSTNWTQTREERDASNPGLIREVPKSLYQIFDESYLYPGSELTPMSHPLFSPGLASDDLLRKALPEKMVLITCGGDQLLRESEEFRARLKGWGKRVDGYVVEGVGHAWDKIPSFRKGNPKRDAAYKLAVASLREFWDTGDESQMSQMR